MNRTLVIVIGMLALSLSFGGVVLAAEQEKEKARMSGGQQELGQQPGEMKQQGQQAMQQTGERADFENLKLGDVLGQKVVSSQGSELGEIHSLIGSDGSLKYVVITGDQDRLFPIPAESFQKGSREGEWLVSLDEEQLKNAPSFELGSWPEMPAGEFEQKVHGYYQQQGQMKTGEAGKEPQAGQPQMARGEGEGQAQQPQATEEQKMEQREQMPREQTMREEPAGGEQQTGQAAPAPGAVQPGTVRIDEQIIGKNVKNPQGEDLGTVEEIVSSPAGDMQYIVVSHGGILGIGEELTPIPWEAAEFQAEQDVVIVDMDKERLKNAPRYTRTEPGQEPEWEREVRAYYGMEQGAQTPSQQPRGMQQQQQEGRQPMEQPGQQQGGTMPEQQQERPAESR